MSDGTPTPEADAAAAPAAAAPADGSSPAIPATPAAPATEAAPEGEAATKDDGATTEADAPAEPQGAPEAYAAFTVPDDVELDADLTTEFSGLAKELNLPQDKAQSVLNLGLKLVEKANEQHLAQLETAKAQWLEQSKADPEIGGAKLTENLVVVDKAKATFATPALTALLNDSGLGNHPEVIRMFLKVGQAISEDRLVVGDAATGDKLTAEERMYPTQARNKNKAA